MAARLLRGIRSMATQAKPGQLRQALPHELEAEAHNAHTTVLWKKISYYAAFPSIALVAVNCLFFAGGHHESEHVKYGTYMRVRSKPFPWGDGDTSLFHNPHANH